MRNIGLDKIEKRGVDDFTTETGIKIRRAIHKPVSKIIELGTKGKIIVEKYPKLDKDTPYIFAASHSFCEEVSALLAKIDHSAYTLIGTTEQLEHNPRIYLNWVTGLVYVDREDEESRKIAIPKMEKVLNNGSSIIIFPEGRLNNTENELCQKLFNGPYKLAKHTGVKVVPISTFNNPGSKEIYLSAADPIDLGKMEKDEALICLRDQLATLQFEQMEAHAPKVHRADMGPDPRLDFMIERMNEYLTLKWTKDVWDEELYGYEDKKITTNNQVRSFYQDMKFNKNNLFLAKDMVEYYKSIEEEEKYNFTKFMHENWNKSKNERPQIRTLKK